MASKNPFVDDEAMEDNSGEAEELEYDEELEYEEAEELEYDEAEQDQAELIVPVIDELMILQEGKVEEYDQGLYDHVCDFLRSTLGNEPYPIPSENAKFQWAKGSKDKIEKEMVQKRADATLAINTINGAVLNLLKAYHRLGKLKFEHSLVLSFQDAKKDEDRKKKEVARAKQKAMLDRKTQNPKTAHLAEKLVKSRNLLTQETQRRKAEREANLQLQRNYMRNAPRIQP